MADSRTLYREILLDHGKAPRNHAPLPEVTHAATADNPVCGDRILVELTVENEHVREARFTIKGCLIATASASLMTEAVSGHPVAHVERLCGEVEASCDGTSAPDLAALGALSALAAVRDYPARRRCATLPWAALREALGQEQV